MEYDDFPIEMITFKDGNDNVARYMEETQHLLASQG
jgi:hypothetical protein